MNVHRVDGASLPPCPCCGRHVLMSLDLRDNERHYPRVR
ncbi:hypothetical protein HNR30_009106 [Nonomuraea soli]|uniref:Uncharacterized protein n=1 Tax=Nonomuraea soli TaxID=1032476 RepID=A0A7W0HW03_9ACTN|nr:hypothetical protein [Nonomuraea soli]